MTPTFVTAAPRRRSGLTQEKIKEDGNASGLGSDGEIGVPTAAVMLPKEADARGLG